MIVIHLHQLGSSTAVDTPKIRDGELEQILEALNKEAATRNQSRREKIEKIQAYQVEFLTKCRNLTQTVLPRITETNTDKPLERAYQLLDNVVSNLQT